jgi:hypothetical protein
MIDARSACLVALLGLVFAPMVVSAAPKHCASETNLKCKPSSVPEPAILLLLAPAAAMLLRSKLKKKTKHQQETRK